MPIYRIQAPDGSILRIEGPDGATEAQLVQAASEQYKPQKSYKPSEGAEFGGWVGRLPGPVLGAMKGVDDVGATLRGLGAGVTDLLGITKGAGDAASAQRALFDRAYANTADSKSFAGLGRVAGQIAATAPLVAATGGALEGAGALANAPTLARLGEAVNKFGFVKDSAPIRMGGGAIAGGVASGSADPHSAWIGALTGGLLPGVAGVAGKVADTVRTFVRPMTEAGRERAAGAVLRAGAEDADAAIAALRRVKEAVPGSAPTTAMASGDYGLASTLNTITDKLPEAAAQARRAADARNAARVAFGHSIGGDESTVAAAIAQRDAVTKPMRDAVLNAAKPIDGADLLAKIDAISKTPQMAGKTTQDALSFVKANLERITQNGEIDPRALYEIRKDINLAIEGKFAGEQGNLRFATKVLSGVKEMIDSAMEGASDGGWRQYLAEYAGRSNGIGQATAVQDVLRRSAAGAVDSTGNPVLYASKLNTILKNEGPELRKALTAEQFDGLRKLATDLSAEQMATSASRSASGNSVTFKMGAADDAVRRALGFVPGGGIVNRAAQWLNESNAQKTMGLLGDSVLNPELAAYLMQAGKMNPVQAGPSLLGTATARALPLSPGLLSTRQQ